MGKKWAILVKIIFGSDSVMLATFLYALLILPVQNCFGLERLEIFIGNGWVQKLECNQNISTFEKKKLKLVPRRGIIINELELVNNM